jgi:hypothetical protein
MSDNHHILDESVNTLIVALSDTEIGKVMLPRTNQWVDAQTGEPVDLLGKQPTMDMEIKALQYANNINDLMPRFIRKQKWQDKDGKEHDMMVMERLYPLPYNHFDVPIRTLMIELLELKLKQLHDNNFVHGDLLRPTNYFTRGNKDWMLKNVMQTESSLRLIDAGFGKICGRDNIKEFVGCLIQERSEFTDVKHLYLSY